MHPSSTSVGPESAADSRNHVHVPGKRGPPQGFSPQVSSKVARRDTMPPYPGPKLPSPSATGRPQQNSQPQGASQAQVHPSPIHGPQPQSNYPSHGSLSAQSTMAPQYAHHQTGPQSGQQMAPQSTIAGPAIGSYQGVANGGIPILSIPIQYQASFQVNTSYGNQLPSQSGPTAHVQSTFGSVFPYPTAHSPSMMMDISHYLSSISSTKIRDILAVAAMHHPDVFEDVYAEWSRTEKQKSVAKGDILSHLGRQSGYEHIAGEAGAHQTRAAYATAFATQMAQPSAPAPAQVIQVNQSPAFVPEMKDVDFSENSSEVDHILYGKYADLRDSEQIDVVHEAVDAIEKEIHQITEMVRPTSTTSTKHNAIRSLCQIGWTIIDGNGYLPQQIKNRMVHETPLVSALDEVFGAMTEAERKAIGANFIDDLTKLEKKRNICFEDLGEVVQRFKEAATGGQNGRPSRNEVLEIDLTG